MIDGVGCYHFLHVVQCCLAQAAWLVRLMMAFMGASLAQPLHAADYDFNDNLLTIGAEFWARLVKERLPLSTQ